MPLPYVAVARIVLASGAFVYLGEKIDGALDNIGKDTYDQAVAEGIPLLKSIVGDLGEAFTNVDWEGVGDAVGKAASEVIRATAEVGSGIAKNIIPDIIEGAEIGYSKIAEKLEERGTEFVGGFTIAFLVVMSIIYMFYEVKRGK